MEKNPTLVHLSQANQFPHEFLEMKYKTKYIIFPTNSVPSVFLIPVFLITTPYLLKLGISNILVFSYPSELQLINKHCGFYMQHMLKSVSLLLILTAQVRAHVISSLDYSNSFISGPYL